MTLQEKKEHLQKNGWEMSWSDDNWVKCDAPDKEANTGLPTEEAFRHIVKKETSVQKTKLQKIVRYYISKSGDKIIKTHNDGREIQVESGQWLQRETNKIDKNVPFDSYDINTQYYLNEIYKQIEQIEAMRSNDFKQLSLF